MSSDTRLYLGDRVDRRQAHEKWRSFSQLGDPYQQTETEANAWMEILNSTDPSYAVEGVSKADEGKARAYEHQIDYALRGNNWTYLQSGMLRVLSYQGMRVIKTGWREIKFAPMRRPTKEQLIDWDEALNEALKTGKVQSPPDPMGQPEEFGNWLQATQSIFPSFPAPPGPSPSEVIQYRGPWFTEVSNFDLAYDPFIERWQDQEVVFQRIVKPREWGEMKVEKGEFDKGQFGAAGRSGPEDSRLSQWDREISSQIGLVQDDNDPRWRTSDEYLEVWRPFDTKAPHLVILNRSAIVNTSVEHPFWHRQLPYVCIKNNPQAGHALGIGSYAQLRRIFSDRLLMRDLMLDGLVLSVMPIFLKNRNLGMTELQRFLQPGMILEVNDANGFKRGWESMQGFSDLLAVSDRLMADQNQILSTGENVRGQTSQVGRVSATESQQRLSQALTRHKQKATRLEEEQTPLLPQALELFYQFMPPDDPQFAEIRRQIIGEDEQDPDAQQPMMGMDGMAPQPMADPRDIFAESLAANARFRGATSARNKELQAQQIKDFLATAMQIQSAAGVPIAIMTPQEFRGMLRRAWEALGQKGGSDIFTAEGDQAVEQMLQAHLVTAQTAPMAAQSQQLQVQGQIQQMMNPQPQIDPATGQPIQGQPAQPGQEQPAPQGNGQAQEAGFAV